MTEPTNTLTFQTLGTIGLAGAEISAYDAASQQVFTTSGAGLQIIDLSDPANPQLIATIPFPGEGDITSVATSGGLVAVAVAATNRTDPGKVHLLGTDGIEINFVTVGSLPDMVTFTPDGSKVLVANEGEATFAEDVADGVPFANPVGSISVIDLSGGAGAASVQTAGFDAFSAAALKAEGVRLFVGSPGFETTTVAQDLEPEYIAVSPDGQTAFVTLQEANSVAVVDLSGTPEVVDIIALGLKSWDGLQFDPNDRDDGIAFLDDLPIFGMYMPDAIASYAVGDDTYLVTANEGDDRDDFVDETARAGTLTLDPGLPADLQDKIARLTVPELVGVNGDTDGDGDADQILAYGARSFSIWDSLGNQVFDSGDMIDTFVADHFPQLFDDGRSDNKGAEPEGVTIAQFEDRTYAFIALERFNSTMVFDITDPEEAHIATFLANAGDVSPESGIFISGDDSATGHPLFLVSNEVSNTLTVYELLTPSFPMGSNRGDRMVGTISDDAFYAGNGDDLVFGNFGDDILRGGNGDDELDGGWGDDDLFGGNGKDVLIGGLGDDLLVGGNAMDRFVFDNAGETGDDVIRDMTNIDQILLTVQLGADALQLADGVLELADGSVEIVGADALSYEGTVVYSGTTFHVYEVSNFA